VSTQACRTCGLSHPLSTILFPCVTALRHELQRQRDRTDWARMEVARLRSELAEVTRERVA
jgi:hypothetical protein